ncbi:MAG TPA: GNAT family protein [Candidatus Binataceae bacterium]|nr:GNAT family protein [Candidatus Binataceae bacterium]
MIDAHQERKALIADTEISLAGEAVALEPLTPAHCEALEKVAAEFAGKAADYPHSFVPLTPSEVRIYVATALAQRERGERYPFAIRFDHSIIGSTSYFPFFWSWPEHSPFAQRQAPDAIEIGATWIAPSTQRTRCNTEAKLLLLTHAFEEWQVHRVSLKTDERNQRSRNAIERIGAKFDGILRGDMPARDATTRNSAYYSIIANEWPAVRAELEARLARDARR